MNTALLALPLLVLVSIPAFARDRREAVPPPAASSIEGLPIGALPRQQLPARGCAAYLWSAGGSRALVAMASADPAQLRLSMAGVVTDLARSAQSGGGELGLSSDTEYQGEGVTVTLNIQIMTRAAMPSGAQVPEGTMRVDRAGQDSFVVPVAGLIGCAV